jgi:hypothetical protein
MATQQFLTKGQSLLLISLDTGYDLTTVDEMKIVYKKPDDSAGEFVATANGTKVEYQCQEGDIDQEGDWEFRSYIVVDGRDAEGDPVKRTFKASIKA